MFNILGMFVAIIIASRIMPDDEPSHLPGNPLPLSDDLPLEIKRKRKRKK